MPLLNGINDDNCMMLDYVHMPLPKHIFELTFQRFQKPENLKAKKSHYKDFPKKQPHLWKMMKTFHCTKKNTMEYPEELRERLRDLFVGIYSFIDQRGEFPVIPKVEFKERFLLCNAIVDHGRCDSECAQELQEELVVPEPYLLEFVDDELQKLHITMGTEADQYLFCVARCIAITLGTYRAAAEWRYAENEYAPYTEEDALDMYGAFLLLKISEKFKYLSFAREHFPFMRLLLERAEDDMLDTANHLKSMGGEDREYDPEDGYWGTISELIFGVIFIVAMDTPLEVVSETDFRANIRKAEALLLSNAGHEHVAEIFHDESEPELLSFILRITESHKQHIIDKQQNQLQFS